MAEVSKIQGPSGSPEPPKKDKTASDDKFKKMMKVDKVRETDPEEQKKRKRSEEAEEEQEEPIDEPAPPPPSTAKSIFTPEKGVGAVGPKEGATAPAGTQSPYVPEAPSSEEAPPAPREEAPPAPTEPAVPRERPRPVSPEEKKSPPAEKKEEERLKPAPSETKKEEEKKPMPLHAPEEKPVEKPLTEEEQLEKLRLEQEKAKEEGKEEKPEEVEEALAPPTHAPAGAPVVKEEEKEKEKKIEEPAAGAAISKEPLLSPTPDLSSVIPATTPPYAYLHPQVLDLFERMAGVITVMTEAGMTETTLTLDAPQFAASSFFGAQVVIQEYTTAPKLFNVQILASPQGVALANANANELMAAFQSGNYNFKINRIETGLLGVDRPLIRRKETPGEKGEKEQGK